MGNDYQCAPEAVSGEWFLANVKRKFHGFESCTHPLHLAFTMALLFPELKSDPGRAVPDYLVTQLEFLAALRYTCEHTSEESTAVSLARAETEFLERHLLNWVATAKAKLDRTNAPGFPVMMTLLVQFLSYRHEGS